MVGASFCISKFFVLFLLKAFAMYLVDWFASVMRNCYTYRNIWCTIITWMHIDLCIFVSSSNTKIGFIYFILFYYIHRKLI